MLNGIHNANTLTDTHTLTHTLRHTHTQVHMQLEDLKTHSYECNEATFEWFFKSIRKDTQMSTYQSLSPFPSLSPPLSLTVLIAVGAFNDH